MRSTSLAISLYVIGDYFLLTSHWQVFELGKRFGSLDKGEDINGIMGSLEMILYYAARVGIIPELHPVLFFANVLLFPSMRGLQFLLDLVDKIVAPRLKGPLLEKSNTGPSDFISHFRRLQSENPEKVRDKDIMSSALANILAGSDTTGISLTAVFYYISKNPKVLDKVRHELEEASNRGEISTPIKFKEAQQLKYLQAVLKEALRCHPVTGLILGRVVPKGGYALAGHFFPAGVSLPTRTYTYIDTEDILLGYRRCERVGRACQPRHLWGRRR
jgi:hypothetical protein